MRTDRSRRYMAPILGVFLGFVPLQAQGQVFQSGSTGSLGAFAPATNTTVVLPADGILNYTTVTIPAGVTVTFQRNAANTPVTLLAQGTVSIAGAIRVDGDAALAGGSPGSWWGITPGQKGGPGGFNGGGGGMFGANPPTANGTGGLGAGGGDPGLFPTISTRSGWYGAMVPLLPLIPLYGGSGGGGGVGEPSQNGPGGAGGGGAIVIASTTSILIQSTGLITANGGTSLGGCARYGAGAGSGGAIRLVAPQITNQGTVQARGDTSVCLQPGVSEYPGVIRVECVTCSLVATTPVASMTDTLGPVTSASTPALTALPSVSISAVGGVVPPPLPTGSHGSPDIVLPEASPLDVTVTLAIQNVPVPSRFSIKMIPAMGEPQFFPTSLSTGSFASSTATALVRMPPDAVCVLVAYLTFPQVAGTAP